MQLGRGLIHVPADSELESRKGGRQPPGAVAEQGERGGEEEAAYEHRVGQDRYGGAEAEDLQDDDVGGAEDADRYGEQDRG